LGCEQTGTRPVVILQNDKGNEVSPITTVVPLTSRKKHYVPTHVPLSARDAGVAVDSLAMAEQIRCVDRCRLLRRLGRITNQKLMHDIACAIRKNLVL
jgi:mRNA interferase MazF